MARRFAKVLEEEIEEVFFYPSDLVNTTILRVSEERWIYTSTLRVSVYIHHYSPALRGIVVYYREMLLLSFLVLLLLSCTLSLSFIHCPTYFFFKEKSRTSKKARQKLLKNIPGKNLLQS